MWFKSSIFLFLFSMMTLAQQAHTHTHTLLYLLIYPVNWSLALWSPQSLNPMWRSSSGWLDDLTYSQPALAQDDSRLKALCLLLLAGMRSHKGVMSAGYLSPVPLYTLSECLSKVVHGDCFFVCFTWQSSSVGSGFLHFSKKVLLVARPISTISLSHGKELILCGLIFIVCS